MVTCKVYWSPKSDLITTIKNQVDDIDAVDRCYVSIPRHDKTDIKDIAVKTGKAKKALDIEIWVNQTFGSLF